MQTTINSFDSSLGMVRTLVDVEVLSPSTSAWTETGSTSNESREEDNDEILVSTVSTGAPLGLTTALEATVPRATFDVHDWRWNNDISEADSQQGGPTPRQRTLSLVQGLFRPIPPSVPETLPSLYAPSTHANEEDDEDDGTEADSIWACTLNRDETIAITVSQQNLLPGVPDDAPLLHRPPEAFEDFPDLDIIIASLRNLSIAEEDTAPTNQQAAPILN